MSCHGEEQEASLLRSLGPPPPAGSKVAALGPPKVDLPFSNDITREILRILEKIESNTHVAPTEDVPGGGGGTPVQINYYGDAYHRDDPPFAKAKGACS